MKKRIIIICAVILFFVCAGVWHLSPDHKKQNADDITAEGIISQKEEAETSPDHKKQSTEYIAAEDIVLQKEEAEAETEEIPSGNMDYSYIDDDLYAVIKEIYDDIDFHGHFNPGDESKYDLYKRQYARFLQGEVTVRIPQTGEELYIQELGEFKTNVRLGTFDIKRYMYYFFDMTGDENPELFVTDKARFTYVFKYDEKKDQVVLWDDFVGSTISFLGTLKLRFAGGWSGDGMISVDSNGNREYFVRFKMYGGAPYQNEIEDYGYLVALPEYIEMTDWMLEQAIYDKLDKRYYFRVTQEQYEELRVEYEDAVWEAHEAIKDVTYTYDELFDGIYV